MKKLLLKVLLWLHNLWHAIDLSYSPAFPPFYIEKEVVKKQPEIEIEKPPVVEPEPVIIVEPPVKKPRGGLVKAQFASGYETVPQKPGVNAKLLVDHPYAQGLVGCWLFNEMTGITAKDYSGNGNHGTLTNMANPGTPTSGWTAGPNGGALAFDFSNDYIQIGAVPTLDLTVSLTVVARLLLKAYSATDSQYFEKRTGGDEQWVWCIGPTGELKVRWHDTGWRYQQTAGVLGLNAWKHIGCSWNGVNSYYYLDGVSYPVAAGVSPLNFQSNPVSQVQIGFGAGGANRQWNGLISDVMIWNRALSAGEIAYLYTNPYCMFAAEYGGGIGGRRLFSGRSMLEDFDISDYEYADDESRIVTRK